MNKHHSFSLPFESQNLDVSSLDHEDLDQVDEYDLEEEWIKMAVEIDLIENQEVHTRRTGHFARECRTKEDNRRRDGWNPGNKDGKRTEKREESRAMVTVDGECVDWTAHTEEDENFAFMASNSSGSNTQAYTQGLKKVEAQLVAHQQGQLWYEQKIKFMKIDLDDKTDVLTYHKTLLAKAQKEKDDLEVIVDKWNHSSKNLGKIINDHMPASDKFGLGYGDYRYSGNLSYENEISKSVFVCNKSDSENRPLHTRLVKPSEMQAVPPPMTGNYLPSGPDIEIDDSQYTYGPQKTQPSKSDSQTIELDTCVSHISTEPSELVSGKQSVNVQMFGVQPKVRNMTGNKADLADFQDFIGGHLLPWRKHLKDKSWVAAMQERLCCNLRFQRNKAKIGCSGHRQEEGIDLTEVFAPVARLEAIGYFLAFASYRLYSMTLCLRVVLVLVSSYSKDPLIFEDSFLWQCKKHNIVATLNEAEYVAAASCCGQVLWIQNQMLDYGFNFMNTKIYIDNESTICIVKNPVYHSKTKHIAIRHHFIRDAYEKKLIQVLKIHTDDNVADLLTKAFDVASRPRNYAVPNRKPKDKPERVGYCSKIKYIFQRVLASVVQTTKRRVYVMFDHKGEAYHWRGDVTKLKLVSIVVDGEGKLV
ncbi:hypothetical protein Tco_1484367 [Tanacetum coccineum]